MAAPDRSTLRSAAAAAITGFTDWVEPPLLAVASVDRIDVERLRAATSAAHLAPGDVLPGARGVVCLFLPFSRRVVSAARRARPEVARIWADAYTQGNRAMEAACSAVVEALRRDGFAAAARPPTADFDPQSLRSVWSHKHLAVATVLGAPVQPVPTRAWLGL